jgi:RHS repeat-associated protein
MADYAYYTPDHLGSVRGIRGQDRSLSASYAYEPYGQTRAASGLPLNVGYTGHLWDATIQQYFAPFRYYNPAAARWTMRDPIGMVDGPNVYAYVKDVPTIYFDDLGLFFLPGAIAGGIVGGILGGIDQAGCSSGSILVGIAIGAIGGGLAGGLPGLWAVGAGAIAGGVDGGIKGGTWSDAFAGAAGGLIAGAAGGSFAARPVGGNSVTSLAGGVAAGAWIGSGQKFNNFFGNGRPGSNCIFE